MPGTWTPLANQPTFSASTMLLLTDGTILCADEGAAVGSPHWWKLTPDASGNYLQGTWTQIADAPTSALFFASAVLADGRVFVAGGEYNGSSTVADVLAAEIYDPQADAWTSLPTPPGWTTIGDAACCVLPDGRIIIGALSDARTAIYDAVAGAWTASASKLNPNCNEESWALMPDGTIVTEDCFGHPAAEKYVIASDQWISIGNTPVDLVEDASKEIGPAILLPDGRLFVIGATGHTALYSMGANPTDPGTWNAGPDVPQSSGSPMGAKDAPGCLLTNGKVLCAVAVVDGNANTYSQPTSFFEYDPQANAFTAVPSPSNGGSAPFTGRMLMVPSGQVLFANGSQDIEVYTPDGAPQPQWAPQITNCPTTLNPGGTFTLQGQQLNGMSQCCGYGDDAAMATNYPIVRLQDPNSGNVFYCRTAGHSTMGVQTGAATVSTQFTVPNTVPAGNYQLVVVANGIASAAVAVSVQQGTPAPAGRRAARG